MASGTKDEEKPDIRRQRLEKALGHPVREEMFAELNERSAGPPELANILGKRLSLITYHYRVLEMLGGIPAPDATES